MNATAPTLPAEGSSATFPCPRCRSAHPWSAEYGGKTARCGCGQVFKFPPALVIPPAPAAPPAAAPPGEPSSQVPGFLGTPGPNAAGDESLSPEIEAELAATAQYGEEDHNKPDPRRDRHVPVALLVVGFVLTVADAVFAAHTHAAAAVAGGVLVAGAKLVIGTLLMLGGALAAARFAGINFGPAGPAILKLAALCLAPSALGDLTTTLLGGDMAVAQIGWVVRVVLYWSLVSYLFRLDGFQTVIVTGSITVVKVVTGVIVGSLFLMSIMPAPDGDGAAGFGADAPMTGRDADIETLTSELDALEE